MQYRLESRRGLGCRIETLESSRAKKKRRIDSVLYRVDASQYKINDRRSSAAQLLLGADQSASNKFNVQRWLEAMRENKV